MGDPQRPEVVEMGADRMEQNIQGTHEVGEPLEPQRAGGICV